jgi:hypothetical protein
LYNKFVNKIKELMLKQKCYLKEICNQIGGLYLKSFERRASF